MYNAKITYPVTELNSSFFLEELRNVLETELINQRDNFGKTFLPQLVKKDEFLLNPITDSDINPAFCAIVKAKSDHENNGSDENKTVNNTFLVKIAAYGLDNLRLIQDSIYEILNDLDVKHYFFQLKRKVLSGDIIQDVTYLVQGEGSITYNGNSINAGDSFVGVLDVRNYAKNTGNEIVINSENNIIFDSDGYIVNSVLTELEVEKTVNDRNLITGVIQVIAPITEKATLNKTTPLEIINTELQVGKDKKSIVIETDLT